MTLQEMIERRAALLQQRKDLHELALTEERDLTDEEQQQFDSWGNDAESISRAIARERMIGDEREAADSESGRLSTPDRPRKPRGIEAERVEIGAPRLAEDPTGGYGEQFGFGNFAYDVMQARITGSVSSKLRAWQTAYLAAGDGMTTTIGHEGGYLLPTQFASLVDRISLEAAVVRPRATRIPMTSQKLAFPYVDTTSHASTVFGGVLAYFKSEESQLTSSKPAFGEAELSLHKLTALAYVSNEMLDWSPISLDSWLPNKLAQAIAWKEDEKFLTGTGAAGEPIGLINASCIISIAKETGQAASTFLFENLIKMEARVWTGNGAGSLVWIANQSLKPQLWQLGHVGEGLQSTPLFIAGNDITGALRRQLVGYPIVFTEKVPALGTTGDIMLCNLSEYLVGDAVGKTRTARDIGLKFDYDQTAFRVVTYTGGMCPWRSALTPMNGDTLSPVVKLDARS